MKFRCSARLDLTGSAVPRVVALIVDVVLQSDVLRHESGRRVGMNQQRVAQIFTDYTSRPVVCAQWYVQIGQFASESELVAV